MSEGSGTPGTSLGGDSAAALAAIVESSDDAIYSKDSKAIVTSWNKAAERLYGYPASEAIGQVVSFIVPEHRRGEEFEILDRVLSGEKVDHFETQRLRKDGTLVDVSVSVSPVRNQQGEIVEAAIIARDLTEQKRLQREAEEARAAQAAGARKQALQLNDEVVQGLAAAKMAFETGELERGLRSVSDTLARAQGIVDDLLEEHVGDEGLQPGDLVRDRPARPTP